MTNFKTVKTRIRIDVAHFQKKYKVLLKNLSRTVYTFYMASTGQLLISLSLEEATKIIRALFVVSKCETDGPECIKLKKWLNTLIICVYNFFSYKCFSNILKNLCNLFQTEITLLKPVLFKTNIIQIIYFK